MWGLQKNLAERARWEGNKESELYTRLLELVLWTYDTKVEMFYHHHVQSKLSNAFLHKHLMLSVKHSDEVLMIWDFFLQPQNLGNQSLGEDHVAGLSLWGKHSLQ